MSSTSPGWYVWVDADDRVVYISKAVAFGGLARRVRDERTWAEDSVGSDSFGLAAAIRRHSLTPRAFALHAHEPTAALSHLTEVGNEQVAALDLADPAVVERIAIRVCVHSGDPLLNSQGASAWPVRERGEELAAWAAVMSLEGLSE